MKITSISAQYLDHMGTDLTAVNAARASFGKDSQWLKSGDAEDYEGQIVQAQVDNDRLPFARNVLKKGDAGLLRFLGLGYTSEQWNELTDEIIETEDRGEVKQKLREAMLHAQHWAPFAHAHLQVRMKLPVFLARQFVKHQVGGTWSEESRRYIDGDVEVWFPGEWHTRPANVKQGSGGELSHDLQKAVNARAHTSVENAIDTYNWMVANGVAPEEARTVLPLNMMTTVVWTGSLLFWARVHNQRVDSHAQLAAQELGRKLTSVVQPKFPVSWKALTA